jgi:type I restriction enzyme R subunit
MNAWMRHEAVLARDLQQQVKSNTLEQFSASPDLHQEFIGAVLGSMESSADLSTQILNHPDIFQKLLAELIPIICKDLAAAG